MYQPLLDPDPRLTRHLVATGALEPPVRVLDGGSRHGAEPHWAIYGDAVEVLAFEPDASEAERLNTEPGSGVRQRHVPMALDRRPGTRQLHVAAFPDSSSLLPNNEPFVDRFGMRAYLRQVRDVDVECTDLDSYLARDGLDLSFVKLDVEGAELAVLEGAAATLAGSVVGLSVEVWFHEDHLGRPRFGDIDGFLRERGFALFDLRQLSRWQRTTTAADDYASWIERGQLMYANALYFRDVPEAVRTGASVARRDVLRLASFAEVFCYPDFAVEVLRAGRAAGVLEADEVAAHEALLLRHSAQVTPRWQTAARKTFRTVVPPAARRRLVEVAQKLLNE